MKLHVLNSPNLYSTSSTQRVVVTYNADTRLTVVDCDVDIVTLGIAAMVLTQQFEEYLNRMPNQEMAEGIKDAIRKAVQNG